MSVLWRLLTSTSTIRFKWTFSKILFLLFPRLLLACTVNPDGEDPVALVMKAAKDHLPADPSGAFNLEGDLRQQGIPGTRLPIEDIVDEILGAEDYRDQLVGRRIYPAKEPQWGAYALA